MESSGSFKISDRMKTRGLGGAFIDFEAEDWAAGHRIDSVLTYWKNAVDQRRAKAQSAWRKFVILAVAGFQLCLTSGQ